MARVNGVWHMAYGELLVAPGQWQEKRQSDAEITADPAELNIRKELSAFAGREPPRTVYNPWLLL